MRQCKSTKLLKITVLLQVLVEPDQSSLVYYLSNVYVHCKYGRIYAMAYLYLRLKLRVEVGDHEKQTCIYAHGCLKDFSREGQWVDFPG